MRYAANENDVDDPLPFVQLAAITANVIAHLKISKHHEADSKRQSTRQRYQDDQFDNIQRPLRKMTAT